MDPDKTTLIDANTEFQGKITGKDARILGRFRGDIELSGRLATGEGSLVEARVKADTAEIAGEFVGELHVRSLLLTEKARVDGTVQAEKLAVREGAFFQAAVNSGVTQPRPAEHRPELRPSLATGR